MRHSRPSPIALNKPHRVFGFDPHGLMGCTVGLAFGLLTMVQSLTLGVVVVALSFLGLGAVYLYGNHKILIVSVCRALFQKARYEPTKRDVFRLEIK